MGIILIIVGLSLIGSVIIMKYDSSIKQKKMIETFERTLKYLGEERVDNNIENKIDLPQNTENNDRLISSAKPENLDIQAIAILVIPKINISVAVAEGTDMETLKYAVGHFEGTAMPGEKGNFCVAGHRSYTYNEFFNKANELSIGDDIIVKTKKGEYTYIIDEVKVVEPTEISVLEPTKEATVTLVTCTPIRLATHRLIIKGKLK
jgi:sortase A